MKVSKTMYRHSMVLVNYRGCCDNMTPQHRLSIARVIAPFGFSVRENRPALLLARMNAHEAVLKRRHYSNLAGICSSMRCDQAKY